MQLLKFIMITPLNALSVNFSNPINLSGLKRAFISIIFGNIFAALSFGSLVSQTVDSAKVYHFIRLNFGPEMIFNKSAVGYSTGAEYELKSKKNTFGFGLSLQATFSSKYNIYYLALPVHYHFDKNSDFWGAAGIAMSKLIIYNTTYQLKEHTSNKKDNPLQVNLPEMDYNTDFLLQAGASRRYLIVDDGIKIYMSPMVKVNLIAGSLVHIYLGINFETFINRF